MLQRWLFHLACVLLALAAPALVNGQPFYFPDTTAYTRAADSAAYVFSSHRISTEWTDRYRRSLDQGAKAVNPHGHISPNVNDLGVESMHGRPVALFRRAAVAPALRAQPITGCSCLPRPR